MAARRPPVKSREFDYSNVGKAGRRTGITLKEGKRDEHGMEEIEGMFSSPGKSPVKANGFANDGIMNSEEMETGGNEAEDNQFAEAPGDYHEGAGNENVDEEVSEVEEEQPEDSPPPVPNPQNKGKKRKEADKVAEEERDEDSANINPPVKRRGRKPKNRQEEGSPETNRGDENPRPAKKAKKAAKASNLQMTAEQEKDLNNVVENITKEDGPLNKKRSLYILRRETPSDDTVRHTRSGRVSVRPLAYWRNEKCVYGTGEAEVGHRFPLSTIKEIIRTEDPELDQAGRKRSSKKKSKGKKKDRGDASDDEPDENVEPWETQEGVFYGPVKIWDPEKQTGTQEEEMMDVAYAPSAIETHEVKDSTFRFAKILSTPFLGSGFVEMPPNAVKKQKNSKRMHMVFFVYYGRIRVDIAGLQFSAGKGCVFQVPRGNNYSFANEYNKPAAIFFTQGCIPLDADGNVDTGVTAPPLPEAPPTEPKANAASKTGKKRGRPKQGAQAG
ncbi:cupin domain-containing protein [Arthroderma uncinatum]|uniref:cupin domain-containing protein n=1 Tax=Arthroderma uncinatum TaxID=74035 RepID=UPI00144AA423|nr:cupin domain-containing protein [Arthroderma uncinatum]KAF3483567.1 cupin domain-containing protein [Arthroderma uncinatum]